MLCFWVLVCSCRFLCCCLIHSIRAENCFHQLYLDELVFDGFSHRFTLRVTAVADAMTVDDLSQPQGQDSGRLWLSGGTGLAEGKATFHLPNLLARRGFFSSLTNPAWVASRTHGLCDPRRGLMRQHQKQSLVSTPNTSCYGGTVGDRRATLARDRPT